MIEKRIELVRRAQGVQPAQALAGPGPGGPRIAEQAQSDRGALIDERVNQLDGAASLTEAADHDDRSIRDAVDRFGG